MPTPARRAKGYRREGETTWRKQLLGKLLFLRVSPARISNFQVPGSRPAYYPATYPVPAPSRASDTLASTSIFSSARLACACRRVLFTAKLRPRVKLQDEDAISLSVARNSCRSTGKICIFGSTPVGTKSFKSTNLTPIRLRSRKRTDLCSVDNFGKSLIARILHAALYAPRTIYRILRDRAR